MTAALTQRAPDHAAAPDRDDGRDAPAIVTRELVKAFKGRAVVDGIDLQVPRGAVYGFLGPNGSGKTTTIRMLLGLIRPAAGDIEVLGRPMPDGAGQVLPRVGALIEGPAFHPYLTGRANLRRLDAADRLADPRSSADRIAAALERVGLTAAAGKRFRTFSLGMKQRLAIAAALLMPRELLVLDEPTNGLDPQGTREVRHLVRELAADGITVFVSSHLLSEIEQIADHVGFMRDGHLVAQGPVAELLTDRTTPGTPASVRIRLTTDAPVQALPVFERLGLSDPQLDGDTVTAALGPAVALADVVPALVAAGVPVLGFGREQGGLEDLFVALTGEGFDVSG